MLIVADGNHVRSPAGTADLADDLQLVTTGRNFLFQPLTLTGDTSAASALASGMSARLAVLIGVHEVTFRRWERGVDRPAERIREAIQRFLGDV